MDCSPTRPGSLLVGKAGARAPPPPAAGVGARLVEAARALRGAARRRNLDRGRLREAGSYADPERSPAATGPV